MEKTLEDKRSDAIRIWRAGVSAVDPFLLIQNAIQCTQQGNEYELKIGDRTERLGPDGKVYIIGMGKATAKMARATEFILKSLIADRRLFGWVNVPDDMVEPLLAIHLHGARPPQFNEPTEQGVAGSKAMVDLLEKAGPDDIIICLVSGGGSALAPLPVPEISLEEKLKITRFLSGAGTNIEELNTVRKELSQLKGGGIRRLCSGKRLFSLILSDVLGDPLDVIASGTTVRNTTNAEDALDVLDKFKGSSLHSFTGIYEYLQNKVKNEKNSPESCDDSRHYNTIIGNNATAVKSAAIRARELGYHPLIHTATRCEGEAEMVGKLLYNESLNLFNGQPLSGNLFDSDLLADAPYDCVISGGEPVVTLVPFAERGQGGRNQQLVLAALIEAIQSGNISNFPVFLSAGSDGEDGPTNAAGAFFDVGILKNVHQIQQKIELSPSLFLRQNDAWNFFDICGGLFIPGPTGTNVCDLRVILK